MNATMTFLLRPAAWAYGHVAARRRQKIGRQARHLPRPVVSVGNITCGGTGKTPTVEMIARDLAGEGVQPAILSRGYGARRPQPASSARDSTAVNDEYAVLAANLPTVPHFQGKERYEQGLRAIESGADVLILDDGFQHVQLKRDLDFVLIDALSPFSNGHVLPAGLLREPLPALESADLFGITRGDLVAPTQLATLKSFLLRRFPGIDRVVLRTRALEWHDGCGAQWPVAALEGRRTLAFCGLGHPEAFRLELERVGLDVMQFLCFRDHHRYTLGDLRKIESMAAKLQVDEVVMTQKDAVKLPARVPFSNWKFLRIAQEVIEGEEIYRGALKRLVLTPIS